MRKVHVLLTGFLFLAVAPAYAQEATTAAQTPIADKFGGDCNDGPYARTVKIAWLANDANNTYDGATLTGANQVASTSRATIVPFYAGFDPAVQLTQCMNAVRSGQYDALVLTPADSVDIIPCVTAAKRRGIPVVAVDLPIGANISTVQPQVPGQVGAVLVPPGDWGTDLAAVIAEACPAQTTCDVGYIAGSFDVALDEAALDELDALAVTHPNIHIVAREEAFYDRTTASVAAHTILQQHPTVNIIIGAGDQMAQGAEDAITALQPGHPIKIIGAGAGEYGIAAVRSGKWYADFIAVPRDEGVFGARIAIRAARGKPIGQPGINPVTSLGYPAFMTTANQAQFAGFVPQWN